MGRTSIIPAKGGAVMLIQKFDGQYAVLQTEDGLISVHRSHLPSAAREGDMVSCNNGGYSIDSAAETDSISDDVRDKLHKLLTGND